MKKLLRNINGELSLGEEFVIILPDDVEGDITFRFKLGNDQDGETHTDIKGTSEHEAIVSIFNPKETVGQTMHNDVSIGTYGGKYTLLFNYTLTPIGNMKWRIFVHFFVEERR